MLVECLKEAEEQGQSPWQPLFSSVRGDDFTLWNYVVLTCSTACSDGIDSLYNIIDIIEKATLVLGRLPLDKLTIVTVAELCGSDRVQEQKAESGLPQ